MDIFSIMEDMESNKQKLLEAHVPFYRRKKFWSVVFIGLFCGITLFIFLSTLYSYLHGSTSYLPTFGDIIIILLISSGSGVFYILGGSLLGGANRNIHRSYPILCTNGISSLQNLSDGKSQFILPNRNSVFIFSWSMGRTWFSMDELITDQSPRSTPQQPPSEYQSTSVSPVTLCSHEFVFE